MERATVAHGRATQICCGPDADKAHKIAEEVKRANVALTAKLMVLR